MKTALLSKFCLTLTLSLCAAGCNPVSYAHAYAEQQRFDAVKPLIAEHVATNLDQQQTWDNFNTAWQKSISNDFAGATSRPSILGK